MTWTSRCSIWTVFLATILPGCGGSDSVTSPTPEPEPILQIRVTEVVQVAQASSNSVAVVLQRTDFSGQVTLSLEGAPEGVTGTFDSNPVVDNGAVLRLSVPESTPVGDYNLTVRGQSTLPDATDTFVLRVEENTVGGPTGSVWSLSSDLFAGSITDFTITFDSEREATRIQYTLNGSSYSYVDSEILGGAIVEGSIVDIDLDWSGNELEFEGTLDAARTTASGLLLFAIEEPAGEKEGAGSGTLSRGAEAPSVSIAVLGETVGVAQGAFVDVSVRISRRDFTGPVTLSLDGAPAGVSASFATNPVQGESTVLRLTVGLGVPVGSYVLMVRGTSDLPDATDSFVLEVEEDAVGGPEGSTWMLTSFQFAGTISVFEITFDTNRKVVRIEYTLNGVNYVYSGSEVIGDADLIGRNVDLDIKWVSNEVENELEFEGDLNQARTAADGLIYFVIVEPSGGRDGFGSAQLIKQ